METPAHTITADNLRAVADLLDTWGTDLPAPIITAYTRNGSVEVDWLIQRDKNQRATMRRIRRIVGGTWDKVGGSTYFTLRRDLADDISLSITCDREQVCERIVVGQENVTIPAVEAQPERTEVRDIVEWRCDPITADDNTTEAVAR